jgi:hypothetical protein
MGVFDAVLPYHGTDNFEITHAVRLLNKYSNVRNIHIVGENPNIDGVIVHDYVQLHTKELNIWNKVFAACFIDGLSDDFLFINDDHFITQSIDTSLPNYYEGTLHDIAANYPNVGYGAAINDTIALLESIGRERKNFDIHCPIFFNKVKFKELFLHLFSGKMLDKDILLKSTYCNYYGVKGRKMADLKFRHLCTTDEFAEKIVDRWVFSTQNGAISRDLKEFILKL